MEPLFHRVTEGTVTLPQGETIVIYKGSGVCRYGGYYNRTSFGDNEAEAGYGLNRQWSFNLSGKYAEGAVKLGKHQCHASVVLQFGTGETWTGSANIMATDAKGNWGDDVSDQWIVNVSGMYHGAPAIT